MPWGSSSYFRNALNFSRNSLNEIILLFLILTITELFSLFKAFSFKLSDLVLTVILKGKYDRGWSLSYRLKKKTQKNYDVTPVATWKRQEPKSGLLSFPPRSATVHIQYFSELAERSFWNPSKSGSINFLLWLWTFTKIMLHSTFLFIDRCSHFKKMETTQWFSTEGAFAPWGMSAGTSDFHIWGVGYYWYLIHKSQGCF